MVTLIFLNRNYIMRTFLYLWSFLLWITTVHAQNRVASSLYKQADSPCKFPVAQQTYVRDHNDCSVFYTCFGNRYWKLSCSTPYTVWSLKYKVCVWKHSPYDDCDIPDGGIIPPVPIRRTTKKPRPPTKRPKTKGPFTPPPTYRRPTTTVKPRTWRPKPTDKPTRISVTWKPTRKTTHRPTIRWVTRRPPTQAPTKKPTTKPIRPTKKPTTPPTRRTKRPSTRNPFTRPRTTRRPRTKPTTRKPTTKRPTTKKPTTKKPTTRKPATARPTRRPSYKVTTRQPTQMPIIRRTHRPIIQPTTRPPKPTTPRKVTTRQPTWRPPFTPRPPLTWWSTHKTSKPHLNQITTAWPTRPIYTTPRTTPSSTRPTTTTAMTTTTTTPTTTTTTTTTTKPTTTPTTTTSTTTTTTTPTTSLTTTTSTTTTTTTTTPTTTKTTTVKTVSTTVRRRPSYNQQCGVMSEPLIIGGSLSKPRKWPWQVSLQIIAAVEPWHRCGGVLIHPQWVLTAAHCVEGQFYGDIRNWRVVLSEDNLEVESGREVYRRIGRIVSHPGYIRTSNFPNDLALLQLDEPVDIESGEASIACLPEDEDLSLLDNTKCWISGWGETRGSGGQENAMNELSVDILPNWLCSSMWRRVGIHVLDDQVCVGYGENGACYGDSGGPLMCEIGGRYYVTGVMSWLINNCSARGFPNVFTRVTSYLDWIYEKLEYYDWWRYN